MKLHKIIWLIMLPVLFFHNASLGSVQIGIDGVGWRMGKRYERLLGDVMDVSANPGATFDATKVEDAILVLRNELNRNGYLSPEITYILFSESDELGRGKWKSSTELASLKWEEGDRVLFSRRSQCHESSSRWTW